MWEHVHGLHGLHPILGVEHLQVACLCGRVAADVYHPLRCGVEDGLHHIGMHTSPWRVGDDDVGTSVCRHKVIGEDVLHVSGIEERLVLETVETGVLLGILDGLGHMPMT